MAKQRLTDMRLVSQVEYNQAINEAFKERRGFIGAGIIWNTV